MLLKKIKEEALTLRGSVIRAGVFAIAWALCPFWLFLPIALGLFFIPPSQSKGVFPLFLGLIALTAWQAMGFYWAVIFGLLFWAILLIKELYLVDRRSAYEILVLVEIFFLFRTFYLQAGMAFEGWGIASGLIAAAVTGILFSGFLGTFSEGPPSGKTLRRVAGFALFFLSYELLLAVLFLPLDFVYQSSIAFLLIATFIDLARQHFEGTLGRTRVFVTSSAVFAILALILGSARWGL